MYEYVVAGILVAAAAALLAWRVHKAWTGKGTTCGSCGACRRWRAACNQSPEARPPARD